MTDDERREHLRTILDEQNAMASDIVNRGRSMKGLLQAMIDKLDDTYLAHEQILARLIRANTAATALWHDVPPTPKGGQAA